MKKIQHLMIGHGLLVIVVSMLAGFMLGFGLVGGFEIFPGKIIAMPYFGTAEGWARAHSGGLTNGLLILGVALALPLLSLSSRMVKISGYGLIYIGWANTLFYWFGNVAGNRALSFGDNPFGQSDIYGVVGFGFALIAALLVIWILLVAAVNALSAR